MTFLCKWMIFRFQPLIFRGVPLFYTNQTHQQADLDLQDLRLSRSILIIWNTLDAMNHSRRVAFPSISTESPQLSVTWNEDINFPPKWCGFLGKCKNWEVQIIFASSVWFFIFIQNPRKPNVVLHNPIGTCENTNLSNGMLFASGDELHRPSPATNSEFSPENQWLEDNMSFWGPGLAYFQGQTCC